MVDKENQWEDVEYSEEQEEEYSYSDDDSVDEDVDYSEQSEDDGDYEYEDYDEEEEEDAPVQRKSNSLFMILLFFILLGVAGYIAIPKLIHNKKVSEQNAAIRAQQETVADEGLVVSQSSEDLASSFFDDAGGEATDNMMSVNFNEQGEANVATGEGENKQVATVTDAKPSEVANHGDLFEIPVSAEEQTDSLLEENNSIMVVYNKASRLNPFKPPVINDADVAPYEMIDNTQFEIIEPPVTSVPDENLTRLLQAQISGILYDEESPSAIVNLNGLDQFVKIGDVVSGYKIEDITKDKVQISYKSNSYVASVGELFTRGALEKRPAVANLENKFAGRYKNKE